MVQRSQQFPSLTAAQTAPKETRAAVNDFIVAVSAAPQLARRVLNSAASAEALAEIALRAGRHSAIGRIAYRAQLLAAEPLHHLQFDAATSEAVKSAVANQNRQQAPRVLEQPDVALIGLQTFVRRLVG